MSAVLITGGAGFIGSNIVARLAPKASLIVCDRLGHADEAKWRNLAKHDICDIVTPEALFDFLAEKGARLTGVVHMGAISATTETDVDRIVDTNFRLSAKLWDWCAQHQKRLVYASSAATYGGGEQGFLDANDYAATLKLQPLNAYGWSKKLFDLYALREAAAGRAPPFWAGLRFFNVYGPNEQHKGGQKSVVAHMYPRLAAGERVTLFRSHDPAYPDGGQKRDFVAVKDCVDIVEWLLETDVHAGIVNVGTGQARTFLELADALFAALKKPRDVDFVDTPEEIRAKYQYFTQADMGRLRSLGYERQFTPIEAGVADYVLNYLATDDPHV